MLLHAWPGAPLNPDQNSTQPARICSVSISQWRAPPAAIRPAAPPGPHKTGWTRGGMQRCAPLTRAPHAQHPAQSPRRPGAGHCAQSRTHHHALSQVLLCLVATQRKEEPKSWQAAWAPCTRPLAITRDVGCSPNIVASYGYQSALHIRCTAVGLLRTSSSTFKTRLPKQETSRWTSSQIQTHRRGSGHGSTCTCVGLPPPPTPQNL